MVPWVVERSRESMHSLLTIKLTENQPQLLGQHRRLRLPPSSLPTYQHYPRPPMAMRRLFVQSMAVQTQRLSHNLLHVPTQTIHIVDRAARRSFGRTASVLHFHGSLWEVLLHLPMVVDVRPVLVGALFPGFERCLVGRNHIDHIGWDDIVGNAFDKLWTIGREVCET